ncbi:hypothetical protein DV738_g1453, partial [Chaetothyriales sp. CBS 135597]
MAMAMVVAVPTESQLDALLTEYLHLLDRYTVLRAQLSTSLASGFLALAHANRNAAQSLGPGRRYGQDAYDTPLRQCQSHFSNSVATTIPDLVTVIAEMGKAENEIAKLRRELGLDEGTKSQDAILPQPTKAQLSTPSTPSNLLTAFASPHPRVLTLDGASRS